ncbi:MAG: MATE family efflux transporter [Bacillota bacterium]
MEKQGVKAGVRKFNITESDNIRKVTLDLALPAIMEMMMQTLLSFADMAMVGSLGAVAIAAVGLGDTPIFTLMAIFAALGTGTTAVVARYIGANEFEKAKDAARQSIIMGVISGILVSTLVVLFARQIVVFMGGDAETTPFGVQYITITGSAMVFLIISVVMGGTLRGSGDTRTPMIANGIANIVNIIGNFLLIYESASYTLRIPLIDKDLSIFIPGAGMGVAGAAASTAFSRAISCMIILGVLYFGKSAIKFSIKDKYRINLEIIKKILKVGYPAAAEQLAMRFGQMFFGRKVAMLGAVVYASHRVAITAESLSFLPGFGFALAATTLVGQFLGAKKPEMSEKGCYEAVKMGTLVMSAVGLVFFIWPEAFIMFFTKEPEIIRNSSFSLRLVAIAQPFLAAMMIFGGGLRGAGDTKWVFYSTMIGIWGVRLLGTYILIDIFGLGLAGAWIAMVVDLFVRGMFNMLRFRSGGWKHIRI